MKKAVFVTTMLVLALVSAVMLEGCRQQAAGGGISIGGGKCTKKEAYTVQVPYNDTDYEWVEECLDQNGPFCKEVAYTEFTLKATYLSKICEIRITNTGNLTGDWTIRAKFITTNAGGGPTSLPQTKTIKPGETAVFQYVYDQPDNPSGCTNVNDKVPTDKICKCSFIGKKRMPVTVTKYRTETRYRDVEC